MKLLLDENLSWRLVKYLQPHFSDIIHVNDTPLARPARDSDIWNLAKEQNRVVVTIYDDFYQLSMKSGYPPKVILLRCHNLKFQTIGQLLIDKKEAITRFVERQEYGILEIYQKA